MLPRLLLAATTIALAGCETIPRDAFRLTQSALAVRDVQTREYESMTDREILSASTAVLQDMGYAIDEVEEPLGVLSASKRADATHTMKVIGSLALDGVQCFMTLGLGCRGEYYGKQDDVQDIRLTLVSRPQLDNSDNVVVRVTIQRIIWDKKGRLSQQHTISDTEVYAAFFERMSKAVFLEREGV